jgi:serine/threonine protein kinase
MTSHPDPESTTPAPDRDDSPDESAEQQTVPAVESDVAESDAEATIAGPHASGPPADERTVVGESETVHPTSTTDVAPEMTLAEKLEVVLEEFAQTLAPEHQDLNQTLAQTSLKPAFDSNWMANADGKSFSQSGSARPRSIQPAGETSVDSTGVTSADTESPESSLDYLTLDKLGEGGMGTVHLARQVALGREVALKQIHQRSSRQQSVRDEFLTEAVLTGKLEHPNIVPIYEVGESAGGELFYSMKNVKGRAWDDTIDGLSLRENLKILIDVCDAMAFAHAEGVIHRDLKPQNIMTGGFGEVLVLDWGMAVLAAPGEDVKASAGGTPSYMAPEMINPPFLVGPRSDVYLLGAILFRFLTGQAPHAGQSARAAMKSASKNEIVNPDRERMQSLDPTSELLGVALQAMATDPTDRYQTVGEFQQAVREFESHQESLTLAARAEEALQAAEKSDEYTQYSRSMVGFEEAVTLWGGNKVAQEGIERARQAYALCAERKEDYELGLSLLDESVSQHGDAIQRLIAARDERNARQGRLRRLKQGLSLAAVLIVVIVGIAAWWINDARLEAERQEQVAVEQEGIARENETEAVKQKGLAEQNASEALKQKGLADQNASEALKQKGIAETETASAIASREQTEATLARSNHFLAQARWDNNRAADARDLLQKVPRQHRNFEWYLARRQFEGSDVTLYGHTSLVLSVSFSPDGTRIASGSADNTIRLWDAATGEEIHTLKGHTYDVESVSFSPDGTRIASGSYDKTIRLWDASTGEELHTLKGHTDDVASVSFSPDGTRLLSQDQKGQKLIWDLKSGEVLPDGNVDAFPAGNKSSRTTDGRWLAIASQNDVLLVDLAYKQTPQELQRRKLLARPKPRWHSKQFQSAQSSKQWYAAVFHAAWSLKLKPSDTALHDVLQAAHRQLLAAHNGQSPPLPAVVKEMLKLPRGSAAPAEANN